MLELLPGDGARWLGGNLSKKRMCVVEQDPHRHTRMWIRNPFSLLRAKPAASTQMPVTKLRH